MADGGALEVPHPDFAATTGAGRFLFIFQDSSDDYDLVDVVLITRVTVKPDVAA
jgi:hypothetical protein